MEFVELNNGVKMPIIGLGTWNLRNEVCIDTVSKAIQLGYRLIDTAQMYENEKAVALGIKKSGMRREDLFLTTKIYRMSNCYDKTREAIQSSLRNLNVDYIDLVLLHEPYQQGSQMYRALEEAYYEGSIRAIGISNYNEARYEEFIKQCSIIPAVNQVEAHVFYQKWDLHKELKKHGTALQAFSPLAQGSANITKQPLLVSLGRKYGKTPSQIALRFLIQRGISVIPKSMHESRLLENIEILDFEISKNDMQRIYEIDQNKTLFPWTENF